MSDLEKFAVQRAFDKLRAAGVNVDTAIGDASQAMFHSDSSYAARTWAAAHPREDGPACCWGAIVHGPERCLCWIPEYDAEQTDPCPPASTDDIQTAPRMCHDCAYRPGSPERADEFTEEALYELATTGQKFWCHQGMLRPARWRHPETGDVVEGSPDDWQPPIINGVPYRLDGTPGLLCAGYAATTKQWARGKTPGPKR